MGFRILNPQINLIWGQYEYTHSLWGCLEKAHIKPIYRYACNLCTFNVSGIFLGKFIRVFKTVWYDKVMLVVLVRFGVFCSGEIFRRLGEFL